MHFASRYSPSNDSVGEIAATSEPGQPGFDLLAERDLLPALAAFTET